MKIEKRLTDLEQKVKPASDYNMQVIQLTGDMTEERYRKENNIPDNASVIIIEYVGVDGKRSKA